VSVRLEEDRFDGAADERHDRVCFMAEAQGWVMARKPGWMPFVIALEAWERAPLYEVGREAAAQYRELSSRPVKDRP
jgi:hypothetical protein